MLVFGECDIIIFDYCYLAIIDLINSFYLLYTGKLMACLCSWWVCICFFGLILNYHWTRAFFFLEYLKKLTLWLPSRAPQSMSWFSGLCKAGYLLKRLAMKARFNLGFPRTTSVAVTNCRQPSLSACCSMHSALWMSSFSCNEKDVKRLGQGSIHIWAFVTWRRSRVSLMCQVANTGRYLITAAHYTYYMHANHKLAGSVLGQDSPIT